MDVVRRWFAARGAPEAWLTPLVGRPAFDPYGDGRPSLPIRALEWSLREGSTAPRFAWNLGPGSGGAAIEVLRTWGAAPPVLAVLRPLVAHAHTQVGRDGERLKLYVYGRGAPAATLAAVEAAVGAHFPAWCPAAEFVAVDLGDVLAVKRYVTVDGGGPPAVADLAAWADTFPVDAGTPPAARVLSVRAGPGGLVDTTIHVKIDRDASLVARVGTELSDRASVCFREAVKHGLLMVPTYLSRQLTTHGPVHTLYARLRPR